MENVRRGIMRIKDQFGAVKQDVHNAHNSFKKPEHIKNIHVSESGAIKTVFHNEGQAKDYENHMNNHGLNATTSKKMMGHGPEFHVLVNPSIKKDEDVAQEVIQDVLDPNSIAQVDPDKIPVEPQSVMNKSYTPEEVARQVLQKAKEMVGEVLEKARIDEGKPISQKIEMRTGRNERESKGVSFPHPKDQRLGTDDLQTNFVGKPKNPAKTQKLRDFVSKISQKRSKNNL
jgi:hypothetical protein